MTVSRRWLCTALLAAVCCLPRSTSMAQGPAVVTILHFNDVYEIGPVEGGRVGGLSRVATVLKQLRSARPPVLSILAGDYMSLSAIGTAVVDGQPLAGRHMVEVLNAMRLDWATFGNHEFDLSEAGFNARNAESTFHLVTSNVTDVNGQLFPKTARTAIVRLTAGGRTVRVGLIGLTTDMNRQPWVRYAPPLESARTALAELQGKVDAVIAITHLALADDALLVTEFPEIDLVLGGHEHENWLIRRGQRLTPVVKADANVRTVSVVTLTFPVRNGRPSVTSRLQVIDDRVRKDPAVDRVVQKWTTLAFDAFRRSGFTPERVVAVTSERLDGRESIIRNRPGRLTDLIAAGFAHEAKDAQVGILNSGSVRIDDVIPPGPVTEYDTIRILPFGGKVASATLDGTLLARVLDAGLKNVGIGGYLQTWGAARDGDQWLIQGAPLDPAARYRVATTDFLLTGRETNLGFLTETNPGVHDVQFLRDVRMALVDELRATYPPR